VLDYDTFIRCISVWTRQDFGFVINIHVLTNHSKGQRQSGNKTPGNRSSDNRSPGNRTLESQNPKIVENKKYFIKHVKLYN
jgi:hypothetical protein